MGQVVYKANSSIDTDIPHSSIDMPRPPNPTPWSNQLGGFSLTGQQTAPPSQPSGNTSAHTAATATPNPGHFVTVFNPEDGTVEAAEVYTWDPTLAVPSTRRIKTAESAGRHGVPGVSGNVGGDSTTGMPEARVVSLQGNIPGPTQDVRRVVGSNVRYAVGPYVQSTGPTAQAPRPQTSMGFRAGISGPGSSTPNTPQQLAPMSAIDSHLTAYPLRGYVSAQAPVASPSSSRVGQSAHAYNYTSSRSSTPSCCRENTQTHTLFILSVTGGIPTTMAHHAVGLTVRSPWFVCPACGNGIIFEANGDVNVPPIGTPTAQYYDERSRSFRQFTMYQAGTRRHSLECPICASRGSTTTLILEVQVHTRNT